jgi:hypothetical protein
MTITGVEMSEPWRRAHEAARTLHDALAAVGIPETELQTLTARDTAAHGLRIVVPPITLDSADALVRALLPNLGPAFVGRVGRPPVPPGHPM